VAGEHDGEEGDDEAEEDGTPWVAEGDVRQRAGEGGGVDRHRIPPAYDQGRRPDQKKQRRQQVERLPLGLVGPGEGGGADLDHGDNHGQGDVRGDRPAAHPPTVGRSPAAVIGRRAAPLILLRWYVLVRLVMYPRTGRWGPCRT
jgi:hypothetical protein